MSAGKQMTPKRLALDLKNLRSLLASAQAVANTLRDAIEAHPVSATAARAPSRISGLKLKTEGRAANGHVETTAQPVTRRAARKPKAKPKKLAIVVATRKKPAEKPARKGRSPSKPTSFDVLRAQATTPAHSGRKPKAKTKAKTKAKAKPEKTTPTTATTTDESKPTARKGKAARKAKAKSARKAKTGDAAKSTTKPARKSKTKKAA